MQLTCSECERPVSSEVPDETVVAALIFCPECFVRRVIVDPDPSAPATEPLALVQG